MAQSSYGSTNIPCKFLDKARNTSDNDYTFPSKTASYENTEHWLSQLLKPKQRKQAIKVLSASRDHELAPKLWKSTEYQSVLTFALYEITNSSWESYNEAATSHALNVLNLVLHLAGHWETQLKLATSEMISALLVLGKKESLAPRSEVIRSKTLEILAQLTVNRSLALHEAQTKILLKMMEDLCDVIDRAAKYGYIISKQNAFRIIEGLLSFHTICRYICSEETRLNLVRYYLFTVGHDLYTIEDIETLYPRLVERLRLYSQTYLAPEVEMLEIEPRCLNDSSVELA